MGSCEFSLKTLAVAVQRDFRQGFNQGINQLSKLIPQDIKIRVQEVLRPEAAYFLTPIETRINPLTGKEDLYWEGYRRSIDESMRRNIALLRVTGASEERINQAIAERRTWQMIRDRGLSLNEGEGIQFLALKTTDTVEGVAIQQLSRRGNQLVLESQLMPFDRADQIENLRESLTERGEDISLIPPDSGVDPAVSWAVQAEAIDFKHDVPNLVEQARQTPFPVVEPVQNQAFLPVADTTLMPEPFIPVSETTGFWFEAAEAMITEKPTRTDFEGLLPAAPILPGPEFLPMEPTPISAVPEIQFADEQRKPISLTCVVSLWPATAKRVVVETATPATSGIDLEGIIKPDSEEKAEQPQQAKKLPTRLLIGKQEKAVVVVFEAPVVQPLVINLEPGEKLKSLAITKQHLNDTVVKARCCFSEPKILEKPEIATIVFESAGQQKKPIQKIVVVRRGERKVEKVIPIYQHNWQAAATKDIPEWVWQGTAATPDEIIDWPWFLVTMFYALLNTKVLLKEKIS